MASHMPPTGGCTPTELTADARQSADRPMGTPYPLLCDHSFQQRGR